MILSLDDVLSRYRTAFKRNLEADALHIAQIRKLAAVPSATAQLDSTAWTEVDEALDINTVAAAGVTLANQEFDAAAAEFLDRTRKLLQAARDAARAHVDFTVGLIAQDEPVVAHTKQLLDACVEKYLDLSAQHRRDYAVLYQ